MSPTERFKRFKDRTGMTFSQLADIFGVGMSCVQQWYGDRNGMSVDCHRTLLRLERDNLAKLSPKLSRETVAAFNAGRERAGVFQDGEQ